MTYEDDKKEKIRVRTIKIAFATLTVLFFATLCGFAWVLTDVQTLTRKTANLTKATAHLTVENTKRIKEIQASRVASCKQTYSGVRKVVKKLLPKHPNEQQQKNIDDFDAVINNLRSGCTKQTDPKLGGS